MSTKSSYEDDKIFTSEILRVLLLGFIIWQGNVNKSTPEDTSAVKFASHESLPSLQQF